MMGSGDVEVTDKCFCDEIGSWRLELASPLLDSVRGLVLEMESVGQGLGISLFLERHGASRGSRERPLGHRKSLSG